MNLDRNVKKNIYWWLCGRQTIKKASAIHFLCEGERRTSMSNIYNVPSFVIPNGIEISRNNTKIKSPCLRAKLGIKEQSLVLLYVGRIHPVKRVELIIESLSYLNSSDIFLIVVGPVLDNNYLDSLKRLSIHCNVDNKLKWIGPISNNAMAEFYEMADLLVLLSEYEGISMTSIEAMNKGTPLLVSEGVLNWKEIVADGAGIVMKNIGPKDISNQLNMLNLDRSYLKKLSQNAIKSAMYRYDIDNVSHLMIKAYMDILTAQRSPELQWNQ
jgi:glycosyltransferase involved in cell wall biosynthesis